MIRRIRLRVYFGRVKSRIVGDSRVSIKMSIKEQNRGGAAGANTLGSCHCHFCNEASSPVTMMKAFDLWYSLPIGMRNGVLSGLTAVALTAVLEVCLSIDDVRQLRSTKAGRELYRDCIWSNIRNNLVLGPITYYLTIEYICRSGPLTLAQQMQSVFGIVLIEGVLFYLVHKAFHEIKGLYWMHRYHHRFNTIVLPSSSNAVSIAEYMFGE